MNERAVTKAMESAISAEMSVEQLTSQVRKIQEAMAAVMRDGEHYGNIPGTKKKVLLKPGAEKLLLLFRLDPQYSVQISDGDGHYAVTTTCTLFHAPSGMRMGSGMGYCSTRESKYAYRKGQRVCPACGSDAIIKSKYPPKFDPEGDPAWFCFGKQGGCGKEFAADDPAITEQQTGRIANEDLADVHNTVLKMSNKRGLVAAVLNVTAASDIFTQDLEDLPETKPARREPTTTIEPDEIARMVVAFEGVSVTRQMIEEYLGHDIEELTVMERKSLRKIHSVLLDGHATWEDCTGNAAAPDPAEKVRAKIRQRREAQRPPAAAAGGE